MTTLAERIAVDTTAAMKAGEKELLLTLRLLRSSLHNAEIETGGGLTEDQAMSVLQKEAKQRRDAIDAFEKGGRADLAAKERAELAIIEEYLPRQLSDDEIATHVKAVIAETGAEGPGDIGKVMGPVMARVAGQADGRRVSALVREHLST